MSKVTGWYAGGVPVLNTEAAVDEYLEAIKVNLLKQKDTEDYLRKRIKELEDEHYKDDALREMTLKLAQVRADARRGFSISEQEEQAISAWKAKHDTLVHNNPRQYHGASGGGYTYKFYPSGLGTFGECVCSNCHGRAFREAAGDVKKFKELMKEWNATFSFDDL